jgi:hypothetical protein
MAEQREGERVGGQLAVQVDAAVEPRAARRPP